MWNFVMSLVVIAALASVAVFSAITGTITAFKSLEHAKLIEVRDGKAEVRIRLMLGPFSYTINVPEHEAKP